MKRKVMNQQLPHPDPPLLSRARCGLCRCRARCNLQRPKGTADTKDSVIDEDGPPRWPLTQRGVEGGGSQAGCDGRNELLCGTLMTYLC